MNFTNIRLFILIAITILSFKNMQRNYSREFSKNFFWEISQFLKITKVGLMCSIFLLSSLPFFSLLKGSVLGILAGGICLLLINFLQKNKISLNVIKFILLDFIILGFSAEFFSSFLFSVLFSN